MDGITRRKGSTNQLVRAKMNGPKGLPALAARGIRCHCMYKRIKHAPPTKPVTSCKTRESISIHMV